MPFTFKNSQKAVAAFFLFGMVLLIAFIILIAKGSDLLTFKDNYYTEYNEGYGMTSGQQIKYKGINIGKIKSISLTKEDKIRVDIWILSDYRYLIRTDSVLKAQEILRQCQDFFQLDQIVLEE